ncbi:hypothetical protein OsI_37034 [Oryza sativa Indica Group]|uniref:Wall-associated receptor kinase galacturonan-binding domain-containing protein n=1 Tax=Oryza sativa subsp. indica TaxID=39946 RepID=B8BIK4_ORYSI|nr:hypothetical protein OsI_37034 [Oryza sativa Indica Group]
MAVKKHNVAMQLLQVVLWLVGVALFSVMASSAPAAVAAAPPPADCPSKCGDVDIPFPFGIGDDHCFWPGFDVVCNHSFTPPRPYYGNMEIKDISLPKGETRVHFRAAKLLRLVQHQQQLRVRRRLAMAQPHRDAVPCVAGEERVHGHRVRHAGDDVRQGGRELLDRLRHDVRELGCRRQRR